MAASKNDMTYLSTRGDGELKLSFEETVMAGLAPDGGLFIPSTLPRLPADWATAWSALSFQELAFEIFSLFISPSEIPSADLKDLISRSYATFRHDEIAPLQRVGEREYILELFHGPTFAFKDVALQFVGNLFEYFLARRNANASEGSADRQRITVVGATSGDTGSAAIYGLRGKKDVAVFILHPKGRVSPIQEAQMTTVEDENVFNLAVKGTFDDCQDVVKALFSDKEFNSTYHLGAVNSINWARILAQITYYFSSYFLLQRTLEKQSAEGDGADYASLSSHVKVQYSVPTGNFGDVLAGFFAKRLGLPMEKLVVATNENDILARFWKSGRYEKADSTRGKRTQESATSPQTDKVEGAADGAQAEEGVKSTHSPAMDILVSSNFERLLWFLAFEHCSHSAHADEQRGDVDGGLRARVALAGKTVQGWMSDLKSEGAFEVPHAVLAAAKREFEAERVDDSETLATIRAYYRSDNAYAGSYVADPHTAVGLAASSRLAGAYAGPEPGRPIRIILSTAHPAKFASAVEDALKEYGGFEFERDVLPAEFRGLLEKKRRVIDVEGKEPELTKEVVKREVEKLWGRMKKDEENTASV